jgi:bifunctional DNase/RNase
VIFVVEMELVGVRLELPANAPIVLLRESSGARRVLPIYIGGPEAAAIAYALENVQVPRPLTHDLLRNVLDELGAQARRVVVTELRDHTFYAEIELVVGKSTHRVSSRPSDAIALAVRTGTPIFAEEQVLDEAGQTAAEVSDDAEEESEELVDEFREFIEHVSPEDFG